MNPNEFCHIELSTDDPAAASAFYGELFSWTLEKMKMSDGSEYTMVKPGLEPGGGIMAKPNENCPTAWMPYVRVSDIQASTERAKDLGGKTIVEPTPISEIGTFSIIQDPTGGVIGLFQGQEEEQR